jgi:hypothetical protein
MASPRHLRYNGQPRVDLRHGGAGMHADRSLASVRPDCSLAVGVAKHARLARRSSGLAYDGPQR